MKGTKCFEVYETSDYSIFKIMETNREIDHVKKIIRSIDTVGYIPSPIICNEKMEIIDGQNRYCALKELGIPIQYYIVKGIGIKEAISLNIGQKNWTPMDYLKCYAEQGNETYQKLQALVEKYKKHSMLSLQEILFVCKKTVTATGMKTDEFKRGNLKLSDSEMKYGEKIMDEILPLEDVIRNMIGTRRLIVTGVAFCMGVKGVNQKRFITMLRNNYPKIRPVCDLECYLDDLTNLYNHKVPKEKWIYFDFEYKTK